MDTAQAERLKKTLLKDEGQKLKVYKDSEGHLTVGVGHKVLPADNLKLGDKITQKKSDAFFKSDMANAVSDAEKFVPNIWNSLSPQRQNVISNMSFNMGTDKLSEFGEFKKGLQAGDYQKAGNEMLSNYDPITGIRTGATPWSNQVHRRADKLNNRMINNIWGSEIPWYTNAGYFIGDQYDKGKKALRELF
jgi:GH24 family phage-related lysozyme (muramidase)